MKYREMNSAAPRIIITTKKVKNLTRLAHLPYLRIFLTKDKSISFSSNILKFNFIVMFCLNFFVENSMDGLTSYLDTCLLPSRMESN